MNKLFGIGKYGRVAVLAAAVVLCMCRNSDGGTLDVFKQAGVEPDAGNGVLTLKAAAETPVSEGTTYWADVYDYQDAITDESVLLTLIGSAPQKLAAGWSVYDAGAANIPLKGAGAKDGKSAVFKQSGKYLTVLTAVDSTGNKTVKYKASLSFEEGNGEWDTSVGGATDSPSLSGNWGSVLVLNNAEAGRGYSAELYSGGSAAGERVGYGWARANASGDAALILFAEAGGVSVPAGNYFVVVTETDFERHVVVKATIGSIGGNTSLDWKTGLQETPAPAPSAVNTGIVTIRNKDLTKTYSADVYPSTGKGGMLKDEAYRVYTAESQRVAAGERQSSVIYLKRNGGEAFTGQGIFLVVLTEFNTGTWKASSRYLGAATFGANGNAVLDWPAMWRVEPPVDMPRPDKGILTLKNAGSAEYTAEVYDFTHNWKFADYKAYKDAKQDNGGKLAEGSRQRPEPYEIWLAKTDDSGSSFDGSGPHMVLLTDVNSGAVKYKTGVIFDKNGCATITLTNTADENAPKPNPPDPRSVVPDSPEAGKLTVERSTDPNIPSDRMADQVYYTKKTPDEPDNHDPNNFADAALAGHGTIKELTAGVDNFTFEGLDYGKDYYIWIRRHEEDGIYSEWVLVAPHNIGEGDIETGETAVNPVEIMKRTLITFATDGTTETAILKSALTLMQEHAGTADTTSPDAPLVITLDALDEDEVEAVAAGGVILTAGASGNAPANVVIDGNGRTVQLTGNGNLLKLNTDSGVTLTLKNITLKGHDSNTLSLVSINANGHLILEDGAIITGNTSEYLSGGGVYAYGGSLTMRGTSIISDNTAVFGGGGVYLAGNNARFEMSGGSIYNNTANGTVGYDYGGGGVMVNVISGTNTNTSIEFNMSGGSISNNTANGYGGGVYVKSLCTSGYSSYGRFIMAESEDGSLPPPMITGNKASSGGGVYAYANGNINSVGNATSIADIANGIVQGNTDLNYVENNCSSGTGGNGTSTIITVSGTE